MTIFICRIMKNARLPLSVSKGTEAQRFLKSKEMSKMLIKELPENSYSADSLTKTVNKILEPHKINFEIIDNFDKNYRGACRLDVNVNSLSSNLVDCGISGYKIVLTKNLEGLYDTFTAVHEFGHMFDHINNPKHNRFPVIKLLFDENAEKKIDFVKKLFLSDEFLSVEKSKQKDAIRRIMTSIPDEYAIDALQMIRNSLKSEKQQYKIGIKFALKQKLKPESGILSELVLFSKLKFNKKLKFANKLLKERLTNVRENLAKKRGD